MTIAVYSGSPADRNIQAPIARALQRMGAEVWWAWSHTGERLEGFQRSPQTTEDVRAVVVCGDRLDALEAAIRWHAANVPILHVAAGDVSGPTYVDARFRDAISALADVLCTTHTAATKRLHATPHLADRRIVQTGLPSLDALMAVKLGKFRPQQYAVIALHPEPWGDVSPAQMLDMCAAAFPFKWDARVMPSNSDGGQQVGMVNAGRMEPAQWAETLLRAGLVIGNSSALVYDCAALGIPAVIVGERQLGRAKCIPWDAKRIKTAATRAIERRKRGLKPSTKYGHGDSADRVAREAIKLARGE